MTDKAKKRRRELAEQLGVSRRTAANIIAARRAAAGYDVPRYVVTTMDATPGAAPGASPGVPTMVPTQFRGRRLAPEELSMTDEQIDGAETRADNAEAEVRADASTQTIAPGMLCDSPGCGHPFGQHAQSAPHECAWSYRAMGRRCSCRTFKLGPG